MVPKLNGVHQVEQFRPISLCNLSYKIITKTNASRLKLVLENIISPSQATFIPNKGMMDNVIISHEVMYLLNMKRGNLELIGLKVDMAKTYDRVE